MNAARVKGWVAVAGMAIAGSALADAPLAQRLRERYAGLESLSAKVVQTKESKFLARPILSRIELDYTPERIVWNTLSPVKSMVVISDAGIRMNVSGQERTVAASGGAETVVRMLRALVSVDLDALKKDFDLAFDATAVMASPKSAAASQPFSSLRVDFDSELRPRSMEMLGKNEKTHLTFEEVKLKLRDGGK